MKIISLLTVSMFTVTSVCCQKNESDVNPKFEDKPVEKKLSGLDIREASGMADSKRNAGYLWVHEDSGNPPLLYALRHDGNVTKKIFIQGVKNRDWEELSMGPGPDAQIQYVYIADIGDNNRRYSDYTIYRFAEPSIDADTVNGAEAIRFTYPDGAHDAEAFFIDRATRDIYIITKRDAKGRIYRIPYPQQTTQLNSAEFVMELPYSGVVACSVSPDGTGILVKTYPTIFYYHRKAGETVKQVFGKKEIQVPYQTEIQGEAVAFANDGTGYFTLSEKAFGSSVSLFFYRKK